MCETVNCKLAIGFGHDILISRLNNIQQIGFT
jgi:hypothetical protein